MDKCLGNVDGEIVGEGAERSSLRMMKGYLSFFAVLFKVL